MKMFNNKAKKEIIAHVKATKSKIKVKPGKCRFNYKCQLNAVHEAIRKNQDRIAMCIYIDSGYPIIHFVNVSKKGKFKDNTLGQWTQTYEYYLIKYIDKEDYFNVDDIFMTYREEIKNNLSFFTKLFSNIDN